MKRNDSNTEAARLTSLEAAMAHLERDHEALNAVVLAQGKVLARLQKRLDEFGETLKHAERDSVPGHNTRPPHYG